MVVLPYDEKWKQDFIDIKNEIAGAVGAYAIAIEHVGSTSVEGLAAKPIIDIDVVVKPGDVERAIRSLESIGYIHEGNLGIEGREAFSYDGKEHLQTHHLYVCPENSQELKRHLAFREYLRSHEASREKYGNVKLEAAKHYPDDIEKYIEYKSPVIEEIYSDFANKMKVGISSCSNGHMRDWEDQVDALVATLNEMNIEAVLAPHIYKTVDEYCGTDAERAEDLMRFYTDNAITAIYDISGGDLANGVLKHLDYEIIAKSNKTFWGYSDLTTVINAIYTMTGKSSVLYQVKNIVWSCKDLQTQRFSDYIKGKNNDLFDIDYDFLQGESMEGIVVGGNIRCFTKLAGTKYWPDMNGKILLLESLGGESGQIATLFNQLDDIGVFQQVAGVLLGTFTYYEKADLELTVYDLLKMHINESLPVAYTRDIGHGHDAKAIRIGESMVLKKQMLFNRLLQKRI